MSEKASEAVEKARQNATSMLPMLQRWVETNSYSASVDGVNAMGDLLAKAFAPFPLTLQRHPGDGVGDHLVWRTAAWDARPDRRIVLIGHHDTVFPPGTFDVWDLDGDRLRGPGVLDMKGGLATIWAAIAGLASAGALATIPLGIVSVGDEEIGSPHSATIVQDFVRNAAGALVFEAGRAGDAIITRRKGTGALIATSTGVGAHAGNHHADGVNAIWALARFIDGVQTLTDYDGGVTVNVGLVAGGEARNTVPPSARCEIDFRFIREVDGQMLVAKVGSLADKITAETGATIEVNGGIRRMPLERTEASAALCARYAEAAIASGLAGPEAGLIGGGSDASTVSSVGVPAIDGLGPRGSGFHTHKEVIEVSSLLLRATALTRFLVAWS